MYVGHPDSVLYRRYISHYGSGTASLNVTVAGSIVLHQFGIWAKYDERAREGEKYIVNHEELKPFNDKDGVVFVDYDHKRNRRKVQLCMIPFAILNIVVLICGLTPFMQW